MANLTDYHPFDVGGCLDDPETHIRFNLTKPKELKKTRIGTILMPREICIV